MKIFYCTDIVMDERSAQTIHIDEVCRNLAQLGHNVTLYAPRPRESAPERLYKTVLIAAPRRMLSVFFQTRLFFILVRSVSRHRPEVIYSRHNTLLFVPVLIGILCGVPVVLEVNGRLQEESKKIDHSLVGRLLLRMGVFGALESFNMRFATGIIAVAPGIKEYLLKKYRVPTRKIHVIYNGVDTNLFNPVTSKTRERLDLDPDALYIGYIGSFFPWQGLRYLVEAARDIIREYPLVKFLILGSGEEEARLISYIRQEGLEHSVEMRPAVLHTLVPRYVQTLDICVSYPTTFRSGSTSPFKVYEYLACAKPVVVSDIGGMRKEFGDAVVYAKPESAAALKGALITLIHDAHMRTALGQRGRQFTEEGHSWYAVAGRVASVCSGAVTEKKH